MNSYIKHIIEAFDFSSIDNSKKKKDSHITNMAKKYIHDTGAREAREVIDKFTAREKLDIDLDQYYAVYKPTNRILKTLITCYCNLYGWNRSLNWLDVSDITDMSDLFLNSKFNGDISSWDVGNVHDMKGMFWDTPFNGDIGKWNVSNVERMEYMFYGSQFN